MRLPGAEPSNRFAGHGRTRFDGATPTLVNPRAPRDEDSLGCCEAASKVVIAYSSAHFTAHHRPALVLRPEPDVLSGL